MTDAQPKSWDALAVALQVNARTLVRWRHSPGAPDSLDLAAWQEWIQASGRRKADAKPATLPGGISLPGHCAYDAAAAMGFPYPQALKREQVRTQELTNRKLDMEISKLQGDLFTAEQVEARDDRWNAEVAALAEDVQRLIDGLPGMTPEARTLYLDRFKEWRGTLAARLASIE